MTKAIESARSEITRVRYHLKVSSGRENVFLEYLGIA